MTIVPLLFWAAIPYFYWADAASSAETSEEIYLDKYFRGLIKMIFHSIKEAWPVEFDALTAGVETRWIEKQTRH